MLKNVKAIVLLALFIPLFSGCVAIPFVAGGAAATPAVNHARTETLQDSDFTALTLANAIEPDVFVGAVKNFAAQLKYPKVSVNGKGIDRTVTMSKGANVGSIDWGSHFRGEQWLHSVTVSLENGRTVSIRAETYGNAHKADPGSARALLDDVKAKVIEQFGGA